ncbi:hypothetical protein Tco_1289774 [Tanacetum coccineum]
MAKDQAIPRRNKMFWHYARDDFMFTTIRVISKHQETQVYGAIHPQHLTNQAMLESEAYKTYQAYATGEKIPKPKYVKNKADFESSPTEKTTTTTKGKRLKSLAKAAKPAKKKQHAKTSKAKGIGGILGVLDVPTYESDDDQIFWKSSKEEDDDEVDNDDDDENDDDDDDNDDEADANNQDDDDDDTDNQDNDGQEYDEQDDENQDDDNEQTDSDNDGDDFIHPKFSTHDKEDKEKDSFDPRVQTPSHFESTDDENSDEEIQGSNVEEDEQDEEVEANELYKDNSSVSSGFVSIMLNPSPDTGIESIFNLNTELTSLINVSVTTIDEPPLLSAITLPPPPTPFITHLQQTPVPKPATLDRLKEKAQAENENFINTLDDNIKKIIKEQVKEQVKAKVSKILPKIEKTVNEQLEAEVLTRSSNESKTSHIVATNLSELELKKILIDKMESNKSIHRSNEQKNLYKALVDTYESDKLILDTYGDTVSFKRRQDDEDKDEEPSAGSNRGSKRRRAGKEPESTNQPDEETPHIPDWFQRPAKPPTPNRDWNKTLPDAHGPVQPWLSSLDHMQDPRESFNELMDTPLDFSAFMMNRVKVDTLTLKLFSGPAFELMKGSCKSLVEIEYFFEEVYKATTNQLDWNNPKGQQYPHDLRKPLPLIPNSRGRRVIPFDHFINNDLEYLSGGVSSRTYTTSVTKTKAADYEHIKWIEDLVPNRMESAQMSTPNAESLLDDDKLYKFKEGNFNRLRIQDIKDMLLLLVQGKLTNLTVEERLAFNVSLRMFTRSIIIQRRVEDLQLGVESYQKKLNLTKPDTLMRIDELHKFSDGTLNDVRTDLNDRLKGIRMKYLPQTIWRQSDRDKPEAIIQAIDK